MIAIVVHCLQEVEDVEEPEEPESDSTKDEL